MEGAIGFRVEFGRYLFRGRREIVIGEVLIEFVGVVVL